MEEILMEEKEQPKVTVTIEAENDILTITTMPETPVPTIVTHDIKSILSEIERIDDAIKSWQDKRKPLQDIVDLYEENVDKE